MSLYQEERSIRICVSPARRFEAPADNFSISCAYRFVPHTLSKLLSPARIACISEVLSSVRSILYPSIIEIPPFAPCSVTNGIPAMHNASISRLIVRRETSNFSARYGAVTFSCCNKIDSIPIIRSSFILLSPLLPRGSISRILKIYGFHWMPNYCF